jgi:hypothetical protein
VEGRGRLPWGTTPNSRAVGIKVWDQARAKGAPLSDIRFTSDGGGERCESMARFEATRPVCSPKAPSMSEKPNWHDAHALMLIDRALEQGTFTAELVAQINQALAAARQADPTHRSATPR